MIPLDTLKQQHQEIDELINVLSLLIPDEKARKSHIVEGLLKDLAKKVGDHLALEDDTLYKELLVHPDPELQRTARNFLSGSHELRRLFTDYVQHACKPNSKSKECEAFVKESQDLFEMLEKRIKFEEEQILSPGGEGLIQASMPAIQPVTQPGPEKTGSAQRRMPRIHPLQQALAERGKVPTGEGMLQRPGLVHLQ